MRTVHRTFAGRTAADERRDPGHRDEKQHHRESRKPEAYAQARGRGGTVTGTGVHGPAEPPRRVAADVQSRATGSRAPICFRQMRRPNTTRYWP